MDRRPVSALAREQLLRIEVARCTRRPVVPPVILERKVISMLNPSKPIQDPSQPSRTTATATTTSTDTSSTAATTATSSTQTSTTAALRTAQTPPVSAGKKLATTSTTAAAAAATATSTATVAAQPAATTTTTTIVGGKRPLAEESPVIILTEHPNEEHKEPTTSDVPGSDSLSLKNQPEQEQEQPHIRKQKPEDPTRKLSTREPTSERGREQGRKGGKNGVQFSDVSPKRHVGDVMQFFQEQEKSLQERFLSLPKKSQKKQRSPSPKLHHAAGLEHLDNLIRLMEQLTSLKDENSRLRKRCDYLESTKILLQAKRDLSLESSSSSSGFMTLPSKQRHHHHQQRPQYQQEQDSLNSRGERLHQYEAAGIITRPRISSADELEYLEFADSSSDQRPRKAKSAMHKRSFSTGSLEVPSEMTTEVGGVETRKRIKGKTSRGIFSKSSSSKPKPKSSKWARVKKVLTGQKLYEDLGTTIRTIRDLGRSSSHVRYSTTGAPGSAHEFSSTSSAVSHGESMLPENEMYGARVPLPVASATMTQSTLQRFQETEDADLTSEIWMGPPDWWEEYEARKEGGGTPTNSDVGSVIEVTTMYLGSSKKETTTSITIQTSTPIASAATTQEKYLNIDKPLSRRQSSPSLVMKESTEEDDILKELTTSTESTRTLHKSQSCKSADLDIPSGSEGRQTKKPHRSAWGRVKDIIHTRKDSIKKKPKREKSGVDSEETSEVDMEAVLEEQWRSDVFDESLVGRSTPKSSPIVVRQHSTRGTSETTSEAQAVLPRPLPSRGSSYQPGSSPGNLDMAALLAGNMSDEFSKKMQEWEQIKSKKSTSFRASVDDSDIGSLDVPSMPHEFPVRVIDLRDLRGKVPDSTSEGITPEESNTSMEVLGAPSVNVEEIQRRMTDSFSRKMQEWERLKYKGSPAAAREPSPDVERKDTKGRKDDRQKSKRSREEKEKEKWERQREREMQKVEREQVKLEKEKLRIEKERLRALEREAKLEKLKGRLSQAEGEGSLKNPVLGPLAEYKVTADFARKLHEWELRKGLSHDVSNSIYLEAQKMSMQHLRQGGRLDTLAKQEQARYAIEGSSRVEPSEKAPPPPPLTLQPYWDSPEDTSPIEKYSEPSIGDPDDETCTSITEECLTKSNIATLERANAQLLENLQKKELEYAAVQEEVRKVNEKLAKVRENHAAEMSRFHSELAKGNFAGPVQLEVGDLETTMGELEEKIKLMENFGEKLASSMESAAVGKWQSIEGEETVHTQLVELVEQMRGMLVQASQSEEQSQKTMALSNFETLYTQAMKLQVQMNNLRLSHLERNREIMMIKRQLLLQEVNNLLLQADITRRETELYQLREAKRFTSLKRWNTFSGAERQRPHTQVELQGSAVKPGRQRESRTRPADSPRINIPFIPEELILASAASSSISAPASPLSIAAAGDAVASSSVGSFPQAYPSPGATHEQSTDHTETHLLLTPSQSRREPRVSPSVWPSLPPQRMKDSRTLASSSQQPLPSLHLPKLAIHIQPRRHPTEDSPSTTSGPLIAEPTTPGPKDLISGELAASVVGVAMADSEEPAEGEKTFIKDQRKRSTVKPEITTLCDSAPLHREIEELKQEKRKVEKGPATLKRTEREGLSSVPSPVRDPRKKITPEVPTRSIPKQRSLDIPRLVKAAPIIDDDYFPAPSVMECTEYVVEQTQLTADTEPGAVGGLGLQRDTAQTTRRDLPLTSDQSKVGSVSPRSPLSKHLMRRQKDERDTKFKDYRAISPKGSPVAARGKPPLPRQNNVSKSSPSASTASDKGPRSKSVSDIDDRAPEVSKPLQEAINRFEKRATFCETEDRPAELRKTPSPTLHLPRVGLVSRVRRLKPAAELLEESQRYRSGHSIYATRILQRYLPKEDHKPETTKTAHTKENHSGTYVHTMVQRLSRESTPVQSKGPSRANSDLSLKVSDSSRAQSDFVTDIVRKLSSPSESEAHKSTTPPKDVTNIGQVKKLSQAFTGHMPSGAQDRTLSDSDIDRQQSAPSTSAMKTQHRKSCEVALALSSATTPTSETSYLMISSESSRSDADSSQRPVSTISPVTCQSLPTIAVSSISENTPPAEDSARGRAATYCVSGTETGRLLQGQETTTYSTSSPLSHETETSVKEKGSKSKGKSGKITKEKGDTGKLPSSLSPDRSGAGRGKMGTVGVLCKQSISFDLGVSLYSQTSQTDETSPKSRQVRSWDPSESARATATATTAAEAETPSTSAATASARASSPTTSGAAATGEPRPVSTSSEGEVAPASPTTAEKKKSRRFLDSSWLQKSKKFFKVSK